MSRTDKKAKFTENNSKKNSAIIIVAALLAVAAIAVFFTMREPAGIEGTTNVGAADYTNQAIEMTTINPEITETKVTVNLDDVKNGKMVAFEVPNIPFTLTNGTSFQNMPMMAYISPKGNLVVARSLCEPCSGTLFHIEGDQLVCNACDTRWDLETLQGISGGCPEHPPETVKYNVEGNQIVIDMETLKNWQPRPI